MQINTPLFESMFEQQDEGTPDSKNDTKGKVHVVMNMNDMKVKSMNINKPEGARVTSFCFDEASALAACFRDYDNMFLKTVKEIEEQIKMQDTFTPLRIVPEGTKTVVFWKDGTTTYVNCSLDDLDSPSVYTAFCAALAKKIFGGTATVKKICDERNTELIKAREAEAKAKAKAEQEAERKRQQEKREKQRIKRLAKVMLKADQYINDREKAKKLADQMRAKAKENEQ